MKGRDRYTVTTQESPATQFDVPGGREDVEALYNTKRIKMGDLVSDKENPKGHPIEKHPDFPSLTRRITNVFTKLSASTVLIVLLMGVFIIGSVLARGAPPQPSGSPSLSPPTTPANQPVREEAVSIKVIIHGDINIHNTGGTIHVVPNLPAPQDTTREEVVRPGPGETSIMAPISNSKKNREGILVTSQEYKDLSRSYHWISTKNVDCPPAVGVLQEKYGNGRYLDPAAEEEGIVVGCIRTHPRNQLVLIMQGGDKYCYVHEDCIDMTGWSED